MQRLHLDPDEAPSFIALDTYEARTRNGSRLLHKGMPSAPPYYKPLRAASAPMPVAPRLTARERGYDGRWTKARRTYLASHPVCAHCALDGFVAVATVVDHLYPHRVYEGVFWESQWWVAMCKACHDGPKQRIEAEGKAALDRLASRLGRPILTRVT